jgi:hypothetical protein
MMAALRLIDLAGPDCDDPDLYGDGSNGVAPSGRGGSVRRRRQSIAHHSPIVAARHHLTLPAICRHHAGMTVAITIRDVPEEVRDTLGQYARQQGQSLQAFLLGVLTRQARFARNRRLLAAVEDELSLGGGAGPDAPSAAEILAVARAEREGGRPGHRSGHDSVR